MVHSTFTSRLGVMRRFSRRVLRPSKREALLKFRRVASVAFMSPPSKAGIIARRACYNQCLMRPTGHPPRRPFVVAQRVRGGRSLALGAALLTLACGSQEEPTRSEKPVAKKPAAKPDVLKGRFANAVKVSEDGWLLD